MSTARSVKIQKRSDAKILKEFGIKQMASNIAGLTTTIEQVANSQVNYERKALAAHDALLRGSAKEIVKVSNAVYELRNRGLWGRVKWLLIGK